MHVAITHAALGSGKGVVKLYLDGEDQGPTPAIGEQFTWEPARAALRLGVNYVGLLDELSVFSRALSPSEIRTLAMADRSD